MTEEAFYSFYKHIKASHKESKAFLLIQISMLRLYLLATGKEDVYEIKYPFKIHLRSIFELLISIVHVTRCLLYSIIGKRAKALILVIEPTHLKQMQGMEPYIKKYNPIFLTTKRNYISILKKTFQTKRVIFIPSFFINPSLVKHNTISDLYNIFKINTTENIIKYSSQIVNDQINNYLYIKVILSILLRFHQSKVAIVFNDLTVTGRIISLILKGTNCKTCYVMHGLLSDEFIESIHVADEFLIFGEYTRPILVKRGIDNKQIKTLGSPYLDYYKQQMPLEGFKNTILQASTNNKFVVLILLSGRGHTTSSKHHDLLIGILNEIIEKNKDHYYFVFKLHKKDYIEYYSCLFDNKNIKNCFAIYPFDYFNGNDSIFEWLKLSNVIITGASTTALEAMYLNKPVITIDLMKEYEEETLYIKQNGTFHCRSKKEVNTTLDQLLNTNFKNKSESIQIAENYFSKPEQMHYFFLTSFDNIAS